MYLCAVVILPDGTEKRIECTNHLKFPAWIIKISRYAKKQNKLKQVISDNAVILAKLREQLPDVKVSYGFREGDQLCVVE